MFLQVASLFVVGLALGSFVPFFPLFIFILLALLGGGFLLTESFGHRSRQQGSLLYGSVLIGVLWCLLFHPSLNSNPLLHVMGTDVRTVVGTIVEPVRASPRRTLMVVQVASVDGQLLQSSSGTGRVRVSWRNPDRQFSKGDRIQLIAKIRPVSGFANPGGFDFAAYLHRQHIQGVVSISKAEHITLLDSGRQTIWWYPGNVLDGWRARIREAAVTSLDGSALGVYVGLIIGEQGYITPSLRDQFMATGTVHILSISGSHLGLIAFLSFFLIREGVRRLPTKWLLSISRRSTPTRIAILGTLVPLSLYTLLAGGEVATIRAFIMVVMCLGALWLGRPQHLFNALALAACVIGIHNPQVLWDLSFQLSFLSVWAIAIVLKWISMWESDEERRPNERWESLYRWCKGYAVVTAGVTLLTLPLVAYHFNQIAWIGLLANFFVIPFAGFVLVPLGLLTACAVLIFDLTTLPFAPFMQISFTCLESMVRIMAQLPGAEWHVPSPTIVTMVMFYSLCLLASRFSGTARIRIVAIAGIIVLLGWWSWPFKSSGHPDQLLVTFLDVGQGDAAVIELPDGKTVLIDAGTRYENFDIGRSVIGPFLWDRRIRRLDVVIGTHPQLDHLGGLPWIVQHFEIGEYWGNGIRRSAAFHEALHVALKDHGLQERRAIPGDLILSSGGCQLWVVSSSESQARPSQAQEVFSGTDLNNQSVVTRLECGAHSFLFAGDIESASMKRMKEEGEAIQSTVVKVPHHGAKSSLDQRWIRQVGAQEAIISVGKHNRFHHPTPEVLQAYGEQTAHIWRTDQHGAISVVADIPEGSLTVQATRRLQPHPIPLSTFSLSQEVDNLALMWGLVTGMFG